MAVGASAGTSGLAATTTPTEPSVGAIRICTDCLSSGADLSRFQYVVLNAWDHDRIAALKQANPNIKVLVYKDMSSSRSYSCGGLIPTGIDYCWADANHPDWFTHKAGSRIQWDGFSGHWQMNVGLQAYQDQWAANVAAELKESYQAATRSFLANVGPKIKNAGFLIIPNIQHHGSLLTASVWKDWIQFTSGGHLEHYTKWGTDNAGHIGGQGWDASGQDFERLTEAAGKIFLGTFSAPTSDLRSMRYARASFLMDWDGGPSALTFEPDVKSADPWAADWTQQIGTPVGTRYQIGNAYRRNYSGGTVLVNPSESSQKIALDGSFLASNSTVVSSVTLAPMTGIVLRTDPSAPVTKVPAQKIKLKIAKRKLVARAIQLKWSGVRSRAVDIYRLKKVSATKSHKASKRRVVIHRIAAANTGSYTAKLGKGAHGTYSFRVCEAGTKRCSHVVRVVLRAKAKR